MHRRSALDRDTLSSGFLFLVSQLWLRHLIVFFLRVTSVRKNLQAHDARRRLLLLRGPFREHAVCKAASRRLLLQHAVADAAAGACVDPSNSAQR